VIVEGYDRKLVNKLFEQGVVVDWREPNVIRLAPVPLYNSFEDIYKLGKVLEQIFNR
jgi:kynureninase